MAVILVCPALVILTVLPEILAIFWFNKVYEKLPVLSPFFVGSTISKLASPNVLTIGLKFVSVGLSLLTIRLAEAVAELKFELASCETVIVVVQAPTIVTVLPLTVATLVSAIE